MNDDSWLSQIQFSPEGLVPVVAQEVRSGAVLMLAWADREALDATLASGLAHYHSRKRGSLWQKGETSGNVQSVKEIRIDCDADAVLYLVEQTGPACHTGSETCFRSVSGESRSGHPLDHLAAVIRDRASARPEDSYTARLLSAGLAKVSQKVGEEAVEVVVAAHAESDERLASESADLLYHLLVLLQARSVPPGAVWRELESRAR